MTKEDNDFLNEVREISYQQIISFYLRYLLLASTKYTNSKTQIEDICSYSLFLLCNLAEKMTALSQLGPAISIIHKAVALDIIQRSKNKNYDNSIDSFLPQNCQNFNLAISLARLEPLNAQIIILHHIQMLSVKQIAQIYDKTPSMLRVYLQRASQMLCRSYNKNFAADPKLTVDNLCIRLDELAESIDPELTKRISENIIDYMLEKTFERDPRFQKYFQNLNLHFD